MIHYTVTVTEENGEFVARDEKGSWRTRGPIDRPRKGRRLALYLFHADEVVDVMVRRGVTHITIATN